MRSVAHLARFIIADITDPKSIPQELQAIVPDLAVPVQPIITRPQQPWGMFVDFPRSTIGCWKRTSTPASATC